jgi:hypothetical protein
MRRRVASPACWPRIDSKYNGVRGERGRLEQAGRLHLDRHNVYPAWANEAVADPEACWLSPDPASISGLSIRVIGYSGSADTILTVILLRGDADPGRAR